MANIDIRGQVRMAAHGCNWPRPFYNLDKLQNYTNSNLFSKFFYLLRFSRFALRKFCPFGGRNINKKNKKNKTDPKNEKFGKFAETRPKKI